MMGQTCIVIIMSCQYSKSPLHLISICLRTLNNAFKIYRGLDQEWLDQDRLNFFKKALSKKHAGASLQGGSIIDPTISEITDEHPVLAGPTFGKEAFTKISALDLSHLYAPEDIAVKKDWKPILDAIDEIRKIVEINGMKMAMVFYPSALQVYPEMRERLIQRLQGGFDFRNDMNFNKIDPQLPQKILFDYCNNAGIDCFDTTVAMMTAASRSDKPLYIKRDTHWNIHGNTVAAAAEAEFLKKIMCP